MTVAQRALAWRLDAAGFTLKEIGAQLDCALSSAWGVLREVRVRSGRPDVWCPGPGRLTLADREEITIGLHRGESFAAIAARIGKHVSSVSREVHANGGREQYRAWRAQQRARERARRPKTPKLACPAAGGAGRARTAPVVVARGNRSAVAYRLRGRSDDVGVTRNDLPVTVCARPRRTAPRADPLFTHRPGTTIIA